MSNRNTNGFGKKPRNKKTSDSTVYVRDNDPRRSGPKAQVQKQSLLNMRMGEFTIDRMGHDGRGVSQWNNKTLFVDGAIVGERVTARLVEDHSRYTEARVDEVLDASPLRQVPPCPHYTTCGGCQLQHLNSEQQIVFKQDALLEQLERWGGVKSKHVVAPIRSMAEGYRRTARLGVWYEESGEVIFGFRQRNSKELVQVDACLVLAPNLNLLLAPLRQWLTELRAVKAVTHIELIDSQLGAAIVVRHTKKLADGDIAQLAALAHQHSAKVWLQGGAASALQNLQGEEVDPRLIYSLSSFDVEMRFHPQDFTQVNPAVNERMVAQAIDWLALTGSERILDLFCGIGNFTLPLARHCAEVIGMEAVDSMVERGRENALAQGITNATFMAADLAKTSENRLHQTCGKIDAVLLDPPRDGAKEIIAKLPQLSPKRIVYVSCNPATLARDAKVLVESGYQLDSVGVMDMFPHTGHVESMALFVRRK